MVENIKTIEFNSTAEIVEKKSRFIANLIYVENEENALNELSKVKKKYYDAKHSCFAFRIMEEGRIIQRFSDDGEPSGTAGAPMLNILEKNNIVNVIIIVTRYFGGILLGTGGLVRAYSDATLKAIESNNLIEKERGYEVSLKYDYSMNKIIEYFMKTNGIKIIKKEYLEEVNMIVEMPVDKYNIFLQEFPKNVSKNPKIEKIFQKMIIKN